MDRLDRPTRLLRNPDSPRQASYLELFLTSPIGRNLLDLHLHRHLTVDRVTGLLIMIATAPLVLPLSPLKSAIAADIVLLVIALLERTFTGPRIVRDLPQRT